MNKIHCLNAISKYGTDLLTDNYTLTDDVNEANSAVIAHIFEVAAKLAKEKGYTNYSVWTLKVYGWRWNIEITNND